MSEHWRRHLLLVLLVFILGRSPGPLRRWLAFKYCEITQREVEYIALSRDTAESDLKQRREITSDKSTKCIGSPREKKY